MLIMQKYARVNFKILEVKMNKIGELIKKHTLLFCIIIGFIISFINELLGRASLLETAKFILDKPLMFT